MPGTNQFYALATGGGANALTNAAYAALATLISSGYQAGTAQSIQVNSTLRQATSVAAAFGKFIADANFNALDDGNIANLTTAFTNALKAVCLPLTGGTLSGDLRVNGNLGVGVAPLAAMHIKGSGGILLLDTTTARGGGLDYIVFNDPSGTKGALGFFGTGDDGLYVYSLMNAPISFYANNIKHAQLQPTGEWGFGQVPTAGYRIDALGTIRSVGGEVASGYSFRALNVAGTGGGGMISNTGSSAGLTITGDGGPINLSANGGPRFVLNAAGLTVTYADSSTALTALSGASNKYTGISVGRTTAEASFGIVGQANNYFNSTAAGDTVLQSSALTDMWLGMTGATGNLRLVTGNVSRLNILNSGGILVRPDIGGSSVDLTDFHTRSQATNGYQKLPGGLIIQWGTSSSISGDSNLAITFPIAFPNNCYNVQSNVLGNSASVGSVNNSSGVLSKTTTGATLVNDSGTASTVMWLAVGN